LRNVLIHFGLLKGEMQIEPTINLTMPDDDCFLISESDGLYEAMVDLGEPVAKGDLLARVWPLDRTGLAPVEYCARRDGLLISRHFPGLIQSGDCVAVIGVTGA
jgi:N-alpha-acetyl-L-2,4-diaminobutyrate deacetylase